jgi:hypothetical protein
MVIRIEVLEVIEEFNSSSRDVKARLIGSTITDIEVLFSGDVKEGDIFPAFRELLEAKLMQPVRVKGSITIGNNEIKVIYTLSSEDPADSIMKILRQYEEGTPVRSEGFED